MIKILTLLKVPFASAKAITITSSVVATVVGGTIATTTIVNNITPVEEQVVEQPVEQPVGNTDKLEEQPQQETPTEQPQQQPVQQQVISQPKVEQPKQQEQPKQETPAPVETPTQETAVATTNGDSHVLPPVQMYATNKYSYTQPIYLSSNSCKSKSGRVYNLNDKYIVFYKKVNDSGNWKANNLGASITNNYQIIKYTDGGVKLKTLVYTVYQEEPKSYGYGNVTPFDDYEYNFYEFIGAPVETISCNIYTKANEAFINDNIHRIWSFGDLYTYNWSWDTVVSKGAALDESKCSQLGLTCVRE